MERFCELVAAMKLRTTNQTNRHLSTNRALELLVEHRIETPDGLVRAPPGLLTRTRVNRYLRMWGLNNERMGRPPPARRFQAEQANECWQFDLSPSDPKHVPAPLWVEAGRGPPTLMLFSGVDVRTHMPRDSDGRRVTARSKGKVERPFRTVKEAHETLYHFHTPQNEAEANLWLRNDLVRYNAQPHRSKPRSRAEDWSSSLPEAGIRAMCAWDRFRTFAREPERRRVGVDARVQVDGVAYEVEPSLAGETVTLWWGLFDHELFVEHEDQRFGPFGPIDGPIPLHRYRSFRKTTADERLDRIEVLAGKLGLPRAALDGPAPVPILPVAAPVTVPFDDPDPSRELRFPSVLAAKLAVADYLGRPLAKLAPEDLGYIEALLKETLERRTVIACVREYFREREARRQGEDGGHAR